MRKRSFSLSEAARKAIEQRSILPFEYQKSGVSKEANPSEPSQTEKISNNHETGKQKLSNENGGVNDLSDTAKPRIAKPVNGPGPVQKSKPVLRPKSTPRPIEQAAKPTAEKSPLNDLGSSVKLTSAERPLERKSPPFGDRYERITTYLEKPLFRRVHELHQRGEIAKIASLMNVAVMEYLNRHYPET